MSTFEGKLKDSQLDFICIDNFLQSVVKGSYKLFVSHYHVDHVKGLTRKMILSSCGPAKFIFCSPSTAHFLCQDRNIPKERFVLLRHFETIQVQNIDRTVTVMVTCFPAGHCVGSIMFLFELDNGKRILYTGDMRLSPADTDYIFHRANITWVHDLYLDTTFMMHPNENFPSRDASEELVIELMKEFLTTRSSSGTIVIDLPGRFTSENLFRKIHQTFKKPVLLHACETKFYNNHDENLETLSEISRFISDLNENNNCSDNYDGIIHGCLGFSDKKNHCPLRKVIESRHKAANVYVIKPSAQAFLKYWNENMKIYRGVPYQRLTEADYKGKIINTRVFYASHCSKPELRYIRNFLKPERIFWNVEPKQEKGNMYHR